MAHMKGVVIRDMLVGRKTLLRPSACALELDYGTSGVAKRSDRGSRQDGKGSVLRRGRG